MMWASWLAGFPRRSFFPVIGSPPRHTLAAVAAHHDARSALMERFENQRRFEEIGLEKFVAVDDQLETTANVLRVLQIYEQMKYSLKDVPSTLTREDVGRMSALPNASQVRRYLQKLYRKELNHWIQKELHRRPQDKVPSDYNRSGIFDPQGNLIYGLWHNSLFTRVNDKLRRLVLARHRVAYNFGQDLLVDCSHSHHLSYHLSAQVAADLASAIHYNFRHIGEPYRITLTGIDYSHYLWHFLATNFPQIPALVSHTETSFLDLLSEDSRQENVTYFTSLERNPRPLEYHPTRHYVVAALSEPSIHRDFLLPSLRKSGIQTAGVPIDRYVLWNHGTKRLTIKSKVKILDQIRRPDASWNQIIRNNIHPDKLRR